MTSFAAMSIAELSPLIHSGSLDPVDLLEAVLSAIDDYGDPAVFVTVLPERARREALEAAVRIKRGDSSGVLDGIPVAWKDLFALSGLVTTAASRALDTDMPARDDAEVVKRLSAAGMVSVGRVNMSEFAFSGLGLNPHFGTPRNPRARGAARIPGGSSSGSAAAVAAGLVPVSIGSDTGGSVRIPAAFNGIVGYKATRGRYPMQGVFPLARSLDSLGTLCRSVQDAVWVDAALAGHAERELHSGGLKGVRIVVPSNVVFDGIEPGVANAFERALERLAAGGAKIVRSAIPAFTEIIDLVAQRGALVTAEAYALHRERVEGPLADVIDRRAVARIRLGGKISAVDHMQIVHTRHRLIDEAERGVDPRVLFAFPTVAHVAPLLAPLEQDDELFVRTNGQTLRNTMLGNFLDWCGVSIPCGTGEAGMPVGLLLSALRGRDDYLLSLALAAESLIRGDDA
jgi:aspartyl-tRNA(Asn)/glutamyl-tRNA(Gln) amidotransferase subunit A